MAKEVCPKDYYAVINPKKILNQGTTDSRNIGFIDDKGIAEVSARVEYEKRKLNGNTPLDSAEEADATSAVLDELKKRAGDHLPNRCSPSYKEAMGDAVVLAYVAENIRLGHMADEIASVALESYKQDMISKKH